MLSMVIWLFGISGSLALVICAVGFGAQSLHMTATASIGLAMVAAAIHQHRTAEMAGDSQAQLAAIATRYIGLLWGWSAVSAAIVYVCLLDWPYATGAVLTMTVLSVLFLFSARILDREASSAQPDVMASKVADWLIRGQFVVSVLACIAAVAWRHGTLFVGSSPETWVAMNIVLASSTAMLAVTGYLVLQDTRRRPSAAQPAG